MTPLSCRQVPISGSDRYFEATFKTQPTHRDLMEAQDAAGYAPQGYGGPSRATITFSDGIYIARWQCSVCCD